MAKAKASKPSKSGKKTGTKSKAAKATAAAKKPKASAKKPKALAKKTNAAPKRRAAARSRASGARAALSAEQKQRLLKPLTSFADLVERLAGTWKEHGRAIRVPGLTAAKLASLLRRAEAASKKEEAVRARLEARLRPLADARLVAEHEAWKAALDVYAMAKAAARTDPGILVPFEFFADALQRRRSGEAAAPEPKEAPVEG
jgi:hypothetical protein